MAAKKPEPVNMMKVRCNLEYDALLLMSAEDAMQFIDILSRTDTYYERYNEDAVFQSGVKTNNFNVSPIPTESVNDLKKAAFMGIPLSEYLKGKENAE
jgi:hypothetical protein